jgi:D-galactarolactone cycloisomerase
VAIAASLQFIATLPDLPSGGAPCFPLRSPMLEFDRTPNPIRDRLAVSPIEHQQGWVDVPDRPGLGIDIDEDALQMFCASG